MGLRLLTRSTRSVSPTEAGERLVESIGPRFEEIEYEIAALSELREKPAGTIRITAGEHAVNTILWPRLDPFLAKSPDIKIEIYIENRLADIVAERHDAGVRLRRAYRKGHDRGSDRARLAACGRRRAIALAAFLASVTARPHQSGGPEMLYVPGHRCLPFTQVSRSPPPAPEERRNRGNWGCSRGLGRWSRARRRTRSHDRPGHARRRDR